MAMPGNDIAKNTTKQTKEECCNACKNKRGCTFFTYRRDKKECWLKNSDAGRKVGRKVDRKAVSGSVDCCKGNHQISK